MSVYQNHGDIIYVKDLDARRKELFDRAGCLDEDAHEELRLLIQFQADVISECGNRSWSESPGFIADSYFDQFQYERQKDIFGAQVVDSGYWDDEEWTDDQREQFKEIDFDGVTYLIDREV